jgi:hypothetical protein
VSPEKPYRSLTAIKRRLVNAAVEIQNEPLDQIAFQHSLLCQVGLPRKETAEREFTRVNGAMSLSIEAGRLFDGTQLVPQPLPYGARPRLILVHISSEAVRTRSPVVEVGNSAYGFMKTLGFGVNGESYRQTRKQVLALSACTMTLGFVANGFPQTVKTAPIKKFEAWLRREGNHTTIWPGILELSPEFFDSLQEHAVPLDPVALKTLRHSSLALDVYTWLSQRLCRVNRLDGVKISWRALHRQFGQEIADISNFRRKMLGTPKVPGVLTQVKTVYSDARFEVVHGGLLLKPSPPPITKIAVQKLMPENGG